MKTYRLVQRERGERGERERERERERRGGERAGSSVEASIMQEDVSPEVDIFACPICYEPLIRKGPSGQNLVGVVHQVAIYRSGFKCERCNKPFSSRNTYLDLTVTSGIREYNEYKPSGTEMFSFSRNGFPGLEEENVSPLQFKMAQEYFEHVAGGLLLDIRSGSGLFSRKFAAKSRTFSKVIALNFSENMLRQCYEFIVKDHALLNTVVLFGSSDLYATSLIRPLMGYQQKNLGPSFLLSFFANVLMVCEDTSSINYNRLR
ncbi:unnamed protein product [Spirodela intermedia]|uniref:Methyltransferase n=1 Tax=Spirodela intermedia TaxID=51605 RepID=A0ABN7E9J1_SPIIN|nr:unnamed protein product [Spirodela intermedia]